MFDPTNGLSSITKLDIFGLVIGHILFAIALIIFIDWNWLRNLLSDEERSRGRSLESLKKEIFKED